MSEQPNPLTNLLNSKLVTFLSVSCRWSPLLFDKIFLTASSKFHEISHIISRHCFWRPYLAESYLRYSRPDKQLDSAMASIFYFGVSHWKNGAQQNINSNISNSAISIGFSSMWHLKESKRAVFWCIDRTKQKNALFCLSSNSFWHYERWFTDDANNPSR